jgi:ABC-type glycerol-3-phosphate transport system substrate-binding protein
VGKIPYMNTLFRAIRLILLLVLATALAACASKKPTSDVEGANSTTSVGGHNYKYTDLIIRDYDEMSNQVHQRRLGSQR